MMFPVTITVTVIMSLYPKNSAGATYPWVALEDGGKVFLKRKDKGFQNIGL